MPQLLPFDESEEDRIRSRFLVETAAIRSRITLILSLILVGYLVVCFVTLWVPTSGTFAITDTDGVWGAFPALAQPEDSLHSAAYMLLIPVPICIFVFHFADALARRRIGRRCRPQKLVVWIRRFKKSRRSYARFQGCLEMACLGLISPVTVYDANLSWPPTQLMAHNPLVSAAVSYRRTAGLMVVALCVVCLSNHYWLWLAWFLLGGPLVDSRAIETEMQNEMRGIHTAHHSLADPRMIHLGDHLFVFGGTLLFAAAAFWILLVPTGLGPRIEFYILRLAEILTRLSFVTEVSGKDVSRFIEQVRAGQQMSIGTHIVRCEQSDWRMVMTELLQSADLVILTGDDLGSSVSWEITEALKYLEPHKILIPIFTPMVRGNARVKAAVELIEKQGIEALLEDYLGDKALSTILSSSARCLNTAYAEESLRSWFLEEISDDPVH